MLMIKNDSEFVVKIQDYMQVLENPKNFNRAIPVSQLADIAKDLTTTLFKDIEVSRDNCLLECKNALFGRLCKKVVIVAAFIFVLFRPVFAVERQNVLFISSYHPAFPTFFQQINGIKTVFVKNDINLDIEFMDTKRFPDKANRLMFERYLVYKLDQSDSYDVVIVADDNALDFALDQQTKLFANTPIVFLGVNNIDRALEQNNNTQVTGVVESVSMHETIELMIKLRPESTRIVALVDNTPSGQGDLKLFYQVAKKFQSYTFSDISLSEMSWSEYFNSLKTLGDDSSVLLLSAYQDKTNITLLFNDSLYRIKEKLSIPLFHLWYHGLGDGILGGKIISHYEQGKVAATIVLRILKGDPVQEIKVINKSPNQYIFDYNELKKYNVSNTLIPEDSIILNEPYSVYKENKLIILSVMSIILILSISLFLLAVSVFRRKKIEETLRENEAHLNTVINTIPDLVWLKDKNGVYLSCNQKFQRLYGANSSDIVGKTDYDFVDKETADFFRKKDKLSITKNGPNINEEEVTYADDGHKEILETVKTPMFKSDGRLIGVLGIARDITKRKQDEENKINAQRIAGEHKKLTLVGQIAGKMAHDFNNILGIIMGHTELTLDDCKDPETRETLELILNQTLRGKNLTKNLVAFAKDQEPKQEFFKMSEKIDLVLNLLIKDLEGLELVTEDKPDMPELLADPGMIEHTLVNLIQNSIHAVSLSECPRIMIKTYSSNNHVFFEIEDNGCGIPEEHLNKIFEPSFTLKGSRDMEGLYENNIKGTGYGMANVKKYIDLHKGTISIRSESGSGTKITVSLPVTKKILTKAEKTELQKVRIHSENSILVVEDEHAIYDVQYRILSQDPCRHKVDIAPNGQAAIDLFDSNEYDLISLDYMLPGGIDGMDVYHHVRKTNKRIPILFISGNIDFLESIKELKQKDTRVDHLSKPCRNFEYVNGINKML